MKKVRWGIIGPGSIANNFADALKQSYSGELTAIASLNDQRRNNFGDKFFFMLIWAVIIRTVRNCCI